ncbi:MAG TPA: helix-turn-helix transcriptional regulator [Ktedonobacteraceae bacterium]|nr:helix-turn-helix transcriptional regulator [Ktedonobacteraceae bacterium]
MEENAFGKLVRAYRKQRGWKQEELAERWNVSCAYVSLIERGKRKLEKQEQINRLVDILGIPEERLAAVGKGMPRRKPDPRDSDDVLLQALLEPAQNTVKLSWLIWHGDSMIVDIDANLRDLQQRLNEALALYHGQFYKPALRLLGYTHEMLGHLEIEKTATKEALFHFQEMYDIADELGDVDMIALAIIHQASMLRRRGWYDTAFRRFLAAEKHIKEAPEKYAESVSQWIQGVLWKEWAITAFTCGDEQGFLRTIDQAEQIAMGMGSSIDSLAHDFHLLEVLQTRAQGFTMLWQPEKALAIYQRTDILRPFRPLRDQASYNIIKAQAHCYAGDIRQGLAYAEQGLKMAEKLHSTRYVTRLRQMSDRLNGTSIGRERAMLEARKEILSTLERMKAGRSE